jgi:hypothetical protein
VKSSKQNKNQREFFTISSDEDEGCVVAGEFLSLCLKFESEKIIGFGNCFIELGCVSIR